MLRALRCFLLVIVTATLLFGKDEPGMVMFWPSQDSPTMKLSFGPFHSMGSYGGKITLLSDVTIQNLSSTAIPQASFSVYLLDKDRVRIGSGFLAANDLQPGQMAKVQFQCDSVGVPATVSLAAKNNGGTPT